jgi:3-phytase/alkaline phosphatase D
MTKKILLLALALLTLSSAATARSTRSVPPASLPQAVASGDTGPTSTVLWARSTAVGNVVITYGTDPTFASAIGVIAASVTDPLVPVKLPLLNLDPATDYYYKVRDALGAEQNGHFRTAAAPGSRSGLRFGVSGDWRGELSPYPAVANADDRGLAVFVALGDTIYADFESPVLPGVSQAISLNQYRLKHTEVYSTRLGLNSLGDLRSTTSWLATIDDHEVVNDFAGGAPSNSDPRFPPGSAFINDTPRYENGVQAFAEYNPLRDEFYGATGDPRTAQERKLYRFSRYGNDAAFFLIDARSFRDTELPPVTDLNDQGQISAYLTATFALTRTMLGQQQLLDLQQDLLSAEHAGVLWKFVMVPEPIQNLGVLAASDRFEGYAAERTRLLKFIRDNSIRNVVFVAADIHGTIVNNLSYQDTVGGPQIPVSSFEITTGPVAFAKPFGPTVAEIAHAAGLINDTLYAIYQGASWQNKDLMLKSAMNDLLTDFGYSPIGLEDGLVSATLVQGTYFATHKYGWTEFDIAPGGLLTVTTYGLDWYSAADLAANPGQVLSRPIEVISKFTVTPQAPRYASFLPFIRK